MLGQMKLKPNLPVAAVIAVFHFGIGFITSLYAAGQADSLGQPHGYGWIVLVDIFLFPFGQIWDGLLPYAHLTDGLVMPAMFVQSACSGLAISLLFHRPRKNYVETDVA